MFKIFHTKNFEKQLAELRPRLYRLAVSWCGDVMLADDLVQTTLNKALIKREQLKDISRIEGWLFRIMHNCWMEYLRTKKPAMDIDDVNVKDDESPEKRYTEQQVVNRVRDAVAILPLIQRQVITLVDLESCSYEQVSIILDIPLGTVMSRLSRARSLLKKRLMGVTAREVGHLNNSAHAMPQHSTPHLRRVK